MKRLLYLLIVLIMPITLLTGCGKTSKSDNFASEENNRFVFVKEYTINPNGSERFEIFVDKETKVMYIYYNSGGVDWATGGLSVMLNNNGTPMLWEGDL
jgi:hypothetical protein